MPSDAIISIRPNFAEAILSGKKTVELRRRIPPLPVGTKLWIYATKPTGAVIGSAVIREIVLGSPDEVWTTNEHKVGVSREEFDAYFIGTDNAAGLVLEEVRRVTPIVIGELRRIRPGFHPPQVIAKITAQESAEFDRLSAGGPPQSKDSTNV